MGCISIYLKTEKLLQFQAKHSAWHVIPAQEVNSSSWLLFDENRLRHANEEDPRRNGKISRPIRQVRVWDAETLADADRYGRSWNNNSCSVDTMWSMSDARANFRGDTARRFKDDRFIDFSKKLLESFVLRGTYFSNDITLEMWKLILCSRLSPLRHHA